MHPIAFKIGNFPIYFYGVMMVVSYLTVLVIVNFTHKLEGFTMDEAVDITIFAVAGGVIGARLFYVALNMGKFLQSPIHIIFVREGGLSWHGGLIGAFIALVILHYMRKLPLGKICDYAAVHSVIALAIGRIGCFLNGCCYGKECGCNWGVEFKEAGITGLRHPTQLYESFMLIIAFIFLLWWWKRKKFDGEMTMIMFALYGVIRFIVEIFRENTPNQYLFGLPVSLAQYLSLALIAVFSVIVFVKRKKTPDKIPAVK